MTEPAATAQLQLALDDITREEIFPLLEKIEGFVDIVEVGTPLLMRYGVSIITEIKQHQPSLKVLSDAKIMDAAMDYLALGPHIVVVGSGITGAPDVAAEAARLHEIIRGAHQ
jgi:3-keto-L-gulonate-6-phosphate decarboxylase